jgi:hypothetical protein
MSGCRAVILPLGLTPDRYRAASLNAVVNARRRASLPLRTVPLARPRFSHWRSIMRAAWICDLLAATRASIRRFVVANFEPVDHAADEREDQTAGNSYDKPMLAQPIAEGSPLLCRQFAWVVRPACDPSLQEPAADDAQAAQVSRPRARAVWFGYPIANISIKDSAHRTICSTWLIARCEGWFQDRAGLTSGRS